LELFQFDKRYVDCLREGDPSTEQHFFVYFGQLMGIMLRGRMLPSERVDEVRQETFFRVIGMLRRKGGVRQPDRFGAFVNSVCKNVLQEKRREWYRNRPIEDGHLGSATHVFDAELNLITEETNKRVRAVLEELGQRDRDLLRAIFLEEKDKDEVCREMGVDRNYLRVCLHRAKERFKVLCGKDLENLMWRTAGKGT
jgi:RNA polymerase sigma-70 factor, ECF subfamily